MAGKVRYMDSTKDEQVRGITMKSSSILLLHKDAPARALRTPDAAPDASLLYAVNLIDSPGHIDFSSDVSTAVRLCDGALVVVDVLEGVCSQTRAVLTAAWKEGVRPCLVFNKMDRLILELQLTPFDAYQRLSRVLEQVNVLASEHFASLLYAKEATGGAGAAGDHRLDPDEADDSAIFFSPAKGNVVFASAIDGWAFSCDSFAGALAPKLGVSRGVLRKALWGEWFWKPKAGKVVGPKAAGKSAEPMFVTHVLTKLWRVYQTLGPDGYDPARVQKMLAALGVTVPTRELAGDVRSRTAAVLRAWLPLPKTVLSMVVRALPSPQEAQASRLGVLCPMLATEGLPPACAPIRDAVARCDSSPDAPVVVFVSKMFAVPTSALPDVTAGGEGGDAPDREHFVAFARVFAGTLRPDAPVYVLGAKYVPAAFGGPPEAMADGNALDVASPHLAAHTEGLALYVMMGRELGVLPAAPAGSVIGIRGLSEVVIKTATLSSTTLTPSLSQMPFQTTPLVRVAIEPKRPADLRQLEAGLQLLNRADPCVEVVLTEGGETHLLALGELHLERCLRELQDRFANVPVTVSPPIMSFYETCVVGTAPGKPLEDGAPLPSQWTDGDGQVHSLTADRSTEVVVRCEPLPTAVTETLQRYQGVAKAMAAGTPTEQTGEFREAVKKAMDAAGPVWARRFHNIWALGPRQSGPNMLVCTLDGTPSFWDKHGLGGEGEGEGEGEGGAGDNSASLENQTPLTSGFQLAMQAGPMCAEPVWGVCMLVEAHTRAVEDDGSEGGVAVSYGALSGQIMGCTKDACMAAFEGGSMRLVEPMYVCDLRCAGDFVGKLYPVLERRRGSIFSEDILGGTSTFVITAYLPVAESFGFANDLRKATSGGATSPQLVFHHWEVLDVDPFFQPKTEEEREEFGDVVHDGQRANIARAYVDGVRLRKGLALDRKIVVHAEKQRNLSRKK